MAAAAVDVGYIAASYAVPETNIQALLSEPTVELVQSLLTQLDAKAREHDELRSENLRLDIELQTAIRDGEARSSTLKATADKAVKDAEELRQQLAQKDTAYQQLETQLQTLQASTTNSSSQVEILEARVKTLESQNRDTVALHEAKSAAHDRLAEELSTQHQKLVALRKQVSELEDKKQELEAAAKDVTFRENNLRQEIDLLRSNNEYLDGELKTRSADNARARKEKNAQIAELQRTNADATQTIDSLRSKETSHTKRIEELEQRVEQSLLRIQQLQEEASQNQQSFRAELDNSRRLGELHQQSANTVKKRLEELQERLTIDGDQAAGEIGRLQAEVDSERQKAAHFEGKVAELELVVENQETQLSELRSSMHVPSTPRRAMNGSFETPGRAGSPVAFTPGGSRLKGGMSMTQLFTENMQLKTDIRQLDDLAKKRSAAMEEMLEELESRQPEIEELRLENERLTSETSEISKILEEALAEKEMARKDARKVQGDYQGLLRERDLDRKIIRDITFQNKLLLYQQRSQEEGLDALTQEEQQFLMDTKDNMIPDHLLDQDDSNVNRLLSQRLVLFRSVAQLVDRNEEVLRMIRDVAEQYEGSEAKAKMAEQERVQKELSKLHETVSQYEDKIKSLDLRSQTFEKERDMYRRIATNRGHGPPGSNAASMFDGTPPPVNSGLDVPPTPQSKEAVENSSVFRDLQKSFDIVREEYTTARATLQQQTDKLTKDIRELQTENVRLTSKQEISQQRQEQQQHRIDALESQKEQLQKRLDAAQDQLATNDLRFQQLMEENIECKSQMENLERANTNLKSSQSLWDTARNRLESEIKALTEAKNLLSRSLDEKRNDYNEQSLMQAENRRLLEARADSLQAELTNAHRKLEDETEEHKRVSVRYELDQADKQRKIDDLLKAANEVRQELASVKTARDQLQLRVSELQTDLRLAEERAQPAPRANGTSDSDEEGLSREEQLTTQLADVQRELERTKEKLELANTNMEVYKNIAQEKEEQLESFTEAHEQNQQDMLRTIEQKEAEIVDLKKRVEDFSSELASTHTELSDLRSTHEKEKIEFAQHKDALETDIARLQNDVNEHEAEMEIQKQLVASQAEIATRAQADYENELSKHGETMKTLRALREQHNKLSTEVTQYKTEAEASRMSLSQNEEHWASVRERLDRELMEARTRYDEVAGQNKTLYEQFDGLNKQIETLQNSRTSASTGQSDAVNLDSSLTGLQALNKSLRDDKDILQLRVNGMELEVQRVRQELAHKQEQLEQANEKLLVEQSHAQNRPSGANLQALQDSIGQLNLYRESNTTLRNDVQRLESERNQKNEELETLRDQLQPLQARVLELEGELEITSGHLKAVEEDRDRWQKRHQDVLQRYDRIDPKELEDLKQQLDTLQSERDQAMQQVNGADERIQSAEQQTKVMEERKNKVVEDARNKLREMKQLKDAAEKERDELRNNLASVQSELTTIREELQSVRKERDEALEKIHGSTDTVMEEEGQVNEDSAALSAEEKRQLEARVSEAERQHSNQSVNLGIQLEELKAREQTLEGQIGELQQRIGVLTKEVDEAHNEKDRANARIAELQSQQPPTQPTEHVQPSEDIQKLKEELTAREKEVEDLRTRADMADSFVGSGDEPSAKAATEPTTDPFATERTALAEREAALAKAEAELEQRKAELEAASLSNTKAESAAEPATDSPPTTKLSIEEMQKKMDSLKKKANEAVKKEKATSAELRTELEEKRAEVARLEKEVERLQTEINDMKQAAPGSTLPGPDASEREVKDFINGNLTAKLIIQRNVKLQLEQGRKSDDTTPTTNADQDKTVAAKIEEATANAKAEHEKTLEQKVENARAMEKNQVEKKFAARESMLKNKAANIKAKWDVVVDAAEKTPEKPVKEVFAVANVAKPPPAPVKTEASVQAPAAQPPVQTVPVQSQPFAAHFNQPTQSQLPGAQTMQPVQPEASNTVPALAAPGASEQQQHAQAAAGGVTQNNAPRAASFGQQSFGPPASNQAGFNNPFQQRGFGNSFPGAMQNQNQFGFGNNPQSGFGASQTQMPQFNQNQTPYLNHNQSPQFNQSQSRPNSPFDGQQQQNFSGGRGRGGDFGTGPSVLHKIIHGQSNIPRGGASGIPQPGGRGRGGPQQQNQGPNAAAHGGASQIGRGGRGGRGGGRGGQPGSPMNPGAPNFNPQASGGRGQKRGPDDDGGHRGGAKRPRGGRGGGGGGGGGGAEGATE